MTFNDVILCPPTAICFIAVSASHAQSVITPILNYMTIVNKEKKRKTSQNKAPSCSKLLWLSVYLYFHSSKVQLSYSGPAEDNLELSDQIKGEKKPVWPPIPHLAIHLSTQPTGHHSNGNQNISVNTFL